MKKITTTNGQILTYLNVGEGQPIMLIHGFAEDQSIWKHQLPTLEKSFQVIVPDLPGTGESSNTSEILSMEEMAEALLQILDEEKIDQIVLIGHSMGGYVSLAFAEKYPSRVKAISLVHSTAYADDDLKKENRRKSIRLIENDGKEVFLKAMIPNLYSQASNMNKKDEMNEHLTIAMKVSSTSLQAYYQGMIERPDRIHILRNTKYPVQFVIGKEDNAVPFAQSMTQCSIPEIAFVDVFQEIGHTSMFESPDELSSMLNSFCKYVFKL